MIQKIELEHGFNSEGLTLKMASNIAVRYVPKTYLTKKIVIKHFNFCDEL